MRHEQNFFDARPLPYETPVGEPPARLNGESTEDIASFAAMLSVDFDPADEIVWPSVMAEAAEAAAQAVDAEPFEATPLNWDHVLSVPPREWIYSWFLIRKFISVLGAPGGTGKTAYTFVVALAIATGQELLGEKVHEPGNVWLYNLEDPRDELERRLRAAAQHHGVEGSEIMDRLFLDCGRERPLVIAKATRDGGMVASPIVKLVIDEIKRRNISVLMVDPFVRSHRLEENVNEQIDFAAALWAQVAEQANCSVLLVHHFRKGGTSGDASAFRGASALIDASRAAMSLAPMSDDEAKRFGIEPEDRPQFIRLDSAKANLAPPPEQATWMRLTSVDIDNATAGRPSDHVQTVARWEPPSAWEGMPMSMVVRILDKIDAGPGNGEFYSGSPQAKDRWAGNVLMEDACKTAAQAKTILKSWVENGVLETGQYASPKQNSAQAGCVRCNKAKVSEMRQSILSASDDAI